MIQSVIRRAMMFSVVLALGGLSACTYWHGDLERLVDGTSRDFRRNPTKTYTPLEMSVWSTNPTPYLFVGVEFYAILNRTGEMGFFAPFYTTMEAENFIAFSAWGSEVDLSKSDGRARSYPLLFIHKLNPSVPELVGADRFSLVRIQGQVMGDFEKKAWFEVSRLEVVDPAVYTDSALADLSLAREALAAKKSAQAIRHFEDALKGIWFSEVRHGIQMDLGRLHEAAGNLDAALECYDGAFHTDPQSKPAVEGMLRVKKAIKERAAAAQQ